MSGRTASNTFELKLVFRSDFNNDGLFKPINLSNCPPHHGARGK